jgi:glutathione synthase/RimK-type ligase-like ATP-grasp enzyme
LPEEVMKSQVINDPVAVQIAVDKLEFFKAMSSNQEISIPEYTTDTDKIVEWLEQGHEVVTRSSLTASGGKGIFIVNSTVCPTMDSLHRVVYTRGVKLATKYVPKKEEYRVHVFNSKVLDVRRKVAKSGIHIGDWKVRSHSNGFIFQKNNIDPDPVILEQAVLAVNTCGLDFGAVDVIWNEFRKRAYVLEVNTAPGLEGSTIEEYAQAFSEYMSELEKPKGGSEEILRSANFAQYLEGSQEIQDLIDIVGSIEEGGEG